MYAILPTRAPAGDRSEQMNTTSEQLTEQDRARIETNRLEAKAKLAQTKAMLAQMKEFEFEHARETEARKWLPNMCGEMDSSSDSSGDEP